MDELTRADWVQIERAVEELAGRFSRPRWGGPPKYFRDLLAKVRAQKEK